MKRLFPLVISALLVSAAAHAQSASPQAPSGVPAPTVTAVIVMVAPKAGVTRPQIMNVMPAEIRATVRLYLDGKIRQWYSRGDGRGVILVLDTKNVDEAHVIMDTLPLAKANLVDDAYIPVGPLMPMAALIGEGPGRQ